MDTNKKQWLEARNAYLESDDWMWVRRQVIRRDKKCRKCHRPYRKSETIWNIHHTSYEHFGAADVFEVEDCRLYCMACHRRVHGLPPLTGIDDELDRIMGWVE